jgi:glycosyltransferase involved in cell wall biosynthesis
MKVLHLNSEKSWRGGEQQMANLSVELNQVGVKSIIGSKPNSKSIQFAKKNDFDYLELPFGGLNILAAISLRNYLLKNKVDLVHTHTANAHTVAVYANIFGANTSIIASKRTNFPIKSKFKFKHASVKKILCVSEMIKTTTHKACPELKNLYTVYSGIDSQRFDCPQKDLKEIYSIDKNKVLVGNCSAITKEKDYFTFIDTAKLLNNIDQQKYHFIIIGSGALEDELKTYAKDMKNITFTGFLPNIHQLLKSLDVFLITSQEEGLGTSILDAMICEVPVVATTAGGMPEIAIHEQTALTSSIKNPQDLAKNVELIQGRDDLVKNAKEMVLNGFTREATAKKTLMHYENVIKS